MPPVQYNWFHKFAQALASQAPVARVLARVLHVLDGLTLKLTGGRLTVTGPLTGVPVVVVETIGARSGRRRALPLLPVRGAAEKAFALIASNFGQPHFPAWYYNLKAHPLVTCTLDGRTAAYSAREVAGEEYDRYWTRALEIYPGYAGYRERAGRRIPIMVLEPEPAS